MIAKIRHFLLSFVTLFTILAISAGIIAYGRGYRFDLGKTSLKPTGLISATSDPIGAQILVDTKLRSATNNSFAIDPGWYTVRLVKEGFQPWEKRVRIQGEVVTRVDAFLFPTSPSLSVLTTSGVVSPVVSPDGTKLAYIVPQTREMSDGQTDRSGAWVLNLVDKPLGLNRDARQIVKTDSLDVSQAKLTWSPDSQQLLVRLVGASYLLGVDELNTSPQVVTNLTRLNQEWDNVAGAQNRQRLLGLDPDFTNIATSSTKLLGFSPDETKVLYEATASATIPLIIDPPLIGTNFTDEVRTTKPGHVYVYDVKEDRNYWLGESKKLPPILWFPTSRHLILVGRDKIEAMEFDGTNRVTVYAGPFGEGFVAPWTNPTKIVILTSLNTAASSVNNLYAVNLR